MTQTTISTAILGLNRETASLGLALKAYSNDPKSKLNFTLIGCDKEKNRMQAARNVGAVDDTKGKLYQAVQGADIVIVALPPGSLEAAYSDFGPELKPGAVVLAMSHAQKTPLDLANQHFPRDDDGNPLAYLVGIHPLVHSDYLYEITHAVEDAEEKLFAGSEMIIAPDVRCPAEAIKLAGDLAEILGMQPRFLSPDEFDGTLDFTEKLPVLLSTALLATLHRSGGRRDLERAINPAFAIMLAALQGLDGDDIAASWVENPEIAVQHLDELINVFGLLRGLIAGNETESIKNLTGELVMALESWQNRRLKGTWEDSTGVKMETGFSFMSNFLGLGAMEKAISKIEKKAEKQK